MRPLVLILLLVLCDISLGQAVWNGRQYNAPVCNKPNCAMCNAIRAQLATQNTPRPAPVQNTTASEYTTVYETQTVVERVKRCNGKQCWYENVTKVIQVPRKVLNNISFRSEAPPVVNTPLVANITPTVAPLLTITELAPTPPEAVNIALGLINPSVDDIFIEPGCGDGRILKGVARICTAIGIELNKDTAEKARHNVNGTAVIITGDALSLNYYNATVVYMYLYPDLMSKIIPLLKPGTRIVSYCHSVPDISWQEHKVGEHTFYTGVK